MFDITHHHQAPFRVWIASDSETGNLVSIEFEIVGSSLENPTDQEKQIRLEALTKLGVKKEFHKFNSSDTREILLGRFIDQHTMEVLSRKELDQKKIPNISGNKADSILVAYVYAKIANTNAPTKVAKLTAERLGTDVASIHRALKIARQHDWLTAFGAGRAGGVLTSKGEDAYAKYKVEERLSA